MSFWIVRAQGLIYGYFNLFNIARYPDAVFRGVFKVIFSYVIPVIIVANVLRVFSHEDSIRLGTDCCKSLRWRAL